MINEDIKTKIINLSLIPIGKILPIGQTEDDGFLIRSSGYFGLAIPIEENIKVDDTFVGMYMKTDILNYHDKHINVLHLFVKDSADLIKFSYVGESFFAKENRKILNVNPYKWIDEWKELFGDSLKRMKVYDVIGELLSLKMVFSKDSTAKWLGPESGTYDIVTSTGCIEVKSTVKKVEKEIVIHGARQLSKNENELLYFCRLEPRPHAHTINSIAIELITLGYNEEELEELLKKVGYPKGRKERENSFDLVCVHSYCVNNDNFPIISLKDINQFGNFNNIIDYTLTLDLSTLPYEVVYEK